MVNKLFPSIKDLANSGYLFRIQDAGDDLLDRITVVFCDGSYLALSKNGLGFSQWGDRIDPQVLTKFIEEGKSVDVVLGDLSHQLQDHILARVNESFSDVMDAVDSLDVEVIAANREQAILCDDPADSAAKGIYRNVSGQYCVRLDGAEEDDYGPYATAREAFMATLPDNYSLSGPEHHSPVDVASFEPTEGMAEKVAALESCQEV